ncbi:MAG: PaaI family thioesterase [Cryomorphaceae bacterium]
MGTRIKITHGEARIEYDVTPHLHHAANAMHGSVYFKLLDDAAYFAVASLVLDVFVLTKSFTIDLKRPFTEGLVRCEGRVASIGDSEFIATSVLTTEDGKILAEGKGHFVRGRTALDTVIEYR